MWTADHTLVNGKESFAMPVSPENQLRDLRIVLPQPPKPLGAYVEAVRVGRLLYLSGALPVEQGAASFIGRIGDDLSIDDGRAAARLATMNAIALARDHLTSLDKVSGVVRLAVSIAAIQDFRDHARVADGASELLAAIFSPQRMPTRMVYGVFTLPLGVCVRW